MKLEWLGGLIVVGLLLGSYALVGKISHTQGMSDVQAKWDKEKKDTSDEVTRLKLVVAAKETEHNILSQRNSDELARTQEEHAKAVAALRADYTERLLLSTSRANVYERLSKGTATERDRLVQHTAELDRTLEEGRSLVRELRQTLGQCEVTVGVLGTQILIDRNLLK
jgi:hypothetical protein